MLTARCSRHPVALRTAVCAVTLAAVLASSTHAAANTTRMTGTPPTVPTNVTGSVTPGDNNNERFTLSWQASTDDRQVLGYVVYINENLAATTATPRITLTLPAGSVNEFRVSAYDSHVNQSATSAPITLSRTEAASPSPVDDDSTAGSDTDTGTDAGTDDTTEDDTPAPVVVTPDPITNTFTSENLDEPAPPSNSAAPTTPSRLFGTMNATSGDVEITWQAASDDVLVKGYNVYRNNEYVTTVFEPRFTGNANPEDVNSYYVVAFDDDGNFSAASGRIALPDRGNQAPFFVNLEDQRIEAGPIWEYRIEVDDLDGGVPGMTIGDTPEGMNEIDNRDGSRTLRWQPLQPDVGVHSIDITTADAEDPKLKTSRTLTLTVVLPDDLSTIPNRPPTIDRVDDFVVRAGDPIVMRVKAVDANGTVPNLEILNPPPGYSFNALEEDPRIRELRYQSNPWNIGITEFSFIARDALDPSLTATSTATLEFRGAEEFVLDGSRLRDLADQAGIQFGFAKLLNIHARPDGALYKDLAAADFNLVTPENSMKWGFANPERGEYRLEDADRVVAFAEAHNMDVHGHTLVWYANLPQWIQQSEVSEREALMNQFIDVMVSRYPNVAFWDVVNEAFEDDGSFRNSVWYEAMGEEHIDKAFRRARQNDPDTGLIYNDYDVAAGGPKTDAMYALVSRLIADGVPIDGVGFQMHVTTGFTDFAAVAETFQRFAALNLDIYITELDVNRVDGDTDVQQAAVYANTIRTCLAQPACKAIQTWGFTDRYTWRAPNTPLLLDEAYQPKPAYTAVQRALGGQ